MVIAICSPYSTIGMAAPVILVMARLVQGFGAGGEFGSASTYLVETAAPSRRAFAGSWQYFGINAGVLLASLIGYVLTRSLCNACRPSRICCVRVAPGQRGANGQGHFSADLVSEQEKVRSADLILFRFPLWWYAVPAILKGWADRCWPTVLLMTTSTCSRRGCCEASEPCCRSRPVALRLN